MSKINSKKRKKLRVSVVLFLLTFVVLIAFVIFYKNTSSQNTETNLSTNPITSQNESWKTYSKPEMRLSFQYPSDWEIVSDDNYPYMVSFTTPDEQQPKHISAAFSVCVDRATLEEIPCDSSFEQTLISTRMGFTSYEETDLDIDGTSAKQFKGLATDNSTKVLTTLVPVGDYYFQFVLQNGSAVESTYQEIVKTLRFIK